MGGGGDGPHLPRHHATSQKRRVSRVPEAARAEGRRKRAGGRGQEGEERGQKREGRREKKEGRKERAGGREQDGEGGRERAGWMAAGRGHGGHRFVRIAYPMQARAAAAFRHHSKPPRATVLDRARPPFLNVNATRHPKFAPTSSTTLAAAGPRGPATPPRSRQQRRAPAYLREFPASVHDSYWCCI